MVVAPEVRAATRTSQDGLPAVRIELIVPRDLFYFEGHFPGVPLLPGVVQLNWAIAFGRSHLDVTGLPQGVANLKFMRVVQPGSEVALLLSFDGARRQLRFEYQNAQGSCASGSVFFKS